jgi:hypothetical protein
VVFYGGVIWDGVEIVLRKKYVDFVIEVVCVYDYCRPAFVSTGNHGVITGDFLVDLF